MKRNHWNALWIAICLWGCALKGSAGGPVAGTPSDQDLRNFVLERAVDHTDPALYGFKKMLKGHPSGPGECGFTEFKSGFLKDYRFFLCNFYFPGSEGQGFRVAFTNDFKTGWILTGQPENYFELFDRERSGLADEKEAAGLAKESLEMTRWDSDCEIIPDRKGLEKYSNLSATLDGSYFQKYAFSRSPDGFTGSLLFQEDHKLMRRDFRFTSKGETWSDVEIDKGLGIKEGYPRTVDY